MSHCKPASLLLSVLLAAAPAAGAANPAATHPAPLPSAGQQAPRPVDPLARTFIVTSRDTFQRHVRPYARNAANRVDGTGTAVVVAELREHQLTEISRRIHEAEHRCGGYFAFATRAEAEAFVRGERSAQALAAAPATYTIDNQDTVLPWLPEADASRIFDAIDHLSQGYRNRYYATGTGRDAAQWIHDTWLELGNGRDDVSAELFTDCANCSIQPSVILTIQGTDLADQVVVLGGHLDSISNSGSGAFMNAPGADDDASGIATLTEVLRVAMADGWRPRRTVKFMGYAAEEVGLRGSAAIAQSFAAQGVDVVGVLQLDMTNYKSGPVPDMLLVTDYSNPDLQAFMTDLFDEYLAPMGLSRGTETCGYACSDHASWTAAGYPSGMMFEAGSPSGYFPYIHTNMDTLVNMGNSAQASVKFAQFGLAFLGEMAKTASTLLGTPKLPECDGRQQQAPALRLSASSRFVQGALPRR